MTLKPLNEIKTLDEAIEETKDMPLRDAIAHICQWESFRTREHGETCYGEAVTRLLRRREEAKDPELTVWFNGTTRLEKDSGEYVVLLDYNTEGLCVHKQLPTLQDAIDEYSSIDFTGAKAIVRMVHVHGGSENKP